MDRKTLSILWRIANGVLSAFFLYSIVDAWLQILYFRNAEKHYYYIATMFFIPLFTCLIVVFGWSLDEK